jgi:glutamate---cysteine ligase / carboxylate-amine ligase
MRSSSRPPSTTGCDSRADGDAAARDTRPVPVRSVGVEEEFLLVDPDSGAPRAISSTVLQAGDDLEGDLAGELQAEQLETGTYPRVDLGEVEREILTRRREASIAAHRAGVEAVPLATYPMPVSPHAAEDPRYRKMMRRFGPTAAEQLTCGCHVHVAVASDEEAVAVVDRIQPWLAVLLALSVNSPFWEGIDSGYSSYRSQVWGRWPSAGPTAPFGSAAQYTLITEQMLRTDTVLDHGMLYFDARPSHHHPTIEVRVADVCREPRDALLLAALTRGLVETAAREWAAGEPAAPVRTELLRLAAWRAGRSGIDDVLLLPDDWRPVAADVVVDALLDHIAQALTDAGDDETVAELWRDLRDRRPGAHHQRRAHREHGLLGVVHDALAVAGSSR